VPRPLVRDRARVIWRGRDADVNLALGRGRG
jgi:hypothetical protein